MTSITNKQIEHLARLSSLSITNEEAKKLQNLLSETIDYINVLEQLNTSNAEMTYQVNNLSNIFLKDTTPCSTLSLEQALKNASQVKDGLIVSKGVFTEQ